MSRDETARERAVLDGVVRHTSASQLQLADASTSQGCLRAWWYEKVELREPAKSKSLDFGKVLHAEIESYLITGIPMLSSLALAGKHMMPEPIPTGPGLWVELPVVPETPEGKPDLPRALVHAAGIPLVGYIDVLSTRGINKGCDNPMDMIDPPGTVEILDWKSTSDAKWAKTGPELIDTIQMTGYGMFALAKFPWMKQARYSHGYFPKKGRQPFKSTILVEPEAIIKSWEHAERVARSIRDAARETDPNKVDANTRACFRFNRDCPHLEYCTAGTHDSLADLIGETAADDLVAQMREPAPARVRLPVIQGDHGISATLPPLGALDSIINGDQGHMTLVPTNPAADSGLGGPPAPVLDLAALADQEAAARDPELFSLIKKIEAHGHGMTGLAGEAAQAYARMRNIPLDANAGFAGTGDLAKWTLKTRAQFAGLLEEIPRFFASAPVAAPSPAPPVVAPPPAPPAPAPAPPPPSVVTTGALTGILPPDALVPVKPVTAPPPSTDPLAATLAQADDKPKRGRPPKAKPPEATTVPPAIDVISAAPVAVASAPRSDAGQTDFDVPNTTVAPIVYVGCIPSCAHQSLWPRVFEQLHALGTKLGAPGGDPRLADPEGKGGFGRWKALLQAFIREVGVPPGHWVIDAAFSEIGQVAVEAYRELAVANKIILVKG